MFPVLALCRIGEADTELIDELKRRYNSVNFEGGGDPVNYKTSLFVDAPEARTGTCFCETTIRPVAGAISGMRTCWPARD